MGSHRRSDTIAPDKHGETRSQAPWNSLWLPSQAISATAATCFPRLLCKDHPSVHARTHARTRRQPPPPTTPCVSTCPNSSVPAGVDPQVEQISRQSRDPVLAHANLTITCVRHG